MAAGMPPSGLNAQAFGSLLRQYVTLSLHRGAAAALTVAFEIRRADAATRGEKLSDKQIKEDIQRIYNDMLAITDPETGVQKLRQDALNKQP